MRTRSPRRPAAHPHHDAPQSESAAPPASSPPSVASLLALQRSHGNRFVRRLIHARAPLVQRDTTNMVSGAGGYTDLYSTETFDFPQYTDAGLATGATEKRERPTEVLAHVGAIEKGKATPDPIAMLAPGVTEMRPKDKRDFLGWARGHIIAFVLGGVGASYNIAPMLPAFNTGAYKTEENTTGGRGHGKGGKYRVKVTLTYGNAAEPRVPTGFTITRERYDGANWVADGAPVTLAHSVPEPTLSPHDQATIKGQLQSAMPGALTTLGPGGTLTKSNATRSAAAKALKLVLDSTQFARTGVTDVQKIVDEFNLTGVLPPLGRAIPSQHRHRPYEELDILFLSEQLATVSMMGGYAIGGDFTDDQRTAILQANMARHGGQIKSDDPADPHQVLRIGGTANRPEIDHIIPKSSGGSNFFSNARVVSWELNNKLDRVKSPAPLLKPSIVIDGGGNLDDRVLAALIEAGVEKTRTAIAERLDKGAWPGMAAPTGGYSKAKRGTAAKPAPYSTISTQRLKLIGKILLSLKEQGMAEEVDMGGTKMYKATAAATNPAAYRRYDIGGTDITNA